MEASVDPLFGGPDWTPITPKRGSFLHADSHEAWEGRSDAFARVSGHVESLIGAREGAAVIPRRG